MTQAGTMLARGRRAKKGAACAPLKSLFFVAVVGIGIIGREPVQRAAIARVSRGRHRHARQFVTEGFAINENGDITRYYQEPSGDFHAFRYTDSGGIQDLGGAAFGPFSQAFGINNAGDVVGIFLDVNFNGHGFLAPAGQGMQDLLTEDRPIAMALSILDDGRLTGNIYSPSGDTHPFRTLLSGEIQDLGDPGTKGTARQMNAAGQVTGELAPSTFPSSGTYTAFRFSDTHGRVDLGTLGGGLSFGAAINASNVIVGCAGLGDVVSHAYRSREFMPLKNTWERWADRRAALKASTITARSSAGAIWPMGRDTRSFTPTTRA